MATIKFNDESSINVNLSSNENSLNTAIKDLNYIPEYKQYEKERQENESIRETNENARISNESERQSNELVRQTNEEERKSNEVTRVANENIRISNEKEREDSELVRQSNETSREEYINSFKADVTAGKFKGEKGDKGDKGDIGASNTLTIGTVSGGENAQATITGTSPSQILNLVLPKGDKGEKGEQGIQGEKGERGLQGEQGVQGIQGERGIKGDTGNDGITPTIGDNGNWYLGTTDTGKPSRGIQGKQGEKGIKGDKGDKGEQGKGVPTGGTIGQVLAKKSDADNDTEWVDQTGGNDVTTDINDTNDNAVPNAKTVKTYVDEKSSRKVASAYLSNAVSSYMGNINLNGIRTTTDKLTLSNGGIKIGSDISRVLVSGNIFLQGEKNDSYLWTSIHKNAEEISNAIDNYNTYFASTSHSPKLIDVKEGDVIYLYQISQAPGKIRAGGNTWLTVEVIE